MQKIQKGTTLSAACYNHCPVNYKQGKKLPEKFL